MGLSAPVHLSAALDLLQVCAPGAASVLANCAAAGIRPRQGARHRPRGCRPREGPSCPRGGVARAARTMARSAFGFFAASFKVHLLCVCVNCVIVNKRQRQCSRTRPAAAGCCTSTGPEAVSRIPPVARIKVTLQTYAPRPQARAVARSPSCSTSLHDNIHDVEIRDV